MSDDDTEDALDVTPDDEEPDTWPRKAVPPLETDPADWADQLTEVPIDDDDWDEPEEPEV